MVQLLYKIQKELKRMRLFSYKDNKRVKLDMGYLTFEGEENGSPRYYREENYHMIDIGLIHKPFIFLQSVFLKCFKFIERSSVRKHNKKEWLTERDIRLIDRSKYDTFWVDNAISEYSDEEKKLIMFKAKKKKLLKSIFAHFIVLPVTYVIATPFCLLRLLISQATKKKKIKKKEVLEKI